MTKHKKKFKSGFVAIMGAPNVGKSTLLNRVLGEKIAAVSSKPQTTRNRILGVAERKSAQIVFLDTPGVHQSKKALNQRMVDAALDAASEVELILLMIDASRSDKESEKMVMRALSAHKSPVILAVNKIDLVKKHELLPLLATWQDEHEFAQIIPVSAKTGEQVVALLDIIEDLLPEGPRLYDPDMLTDMSERFIAAEMIREKVFRMTGQEIPYSTAVTIDTFEETKKLVRIQAVIHVERDSQKGIIIGKGGSMLKTIGTMARKELEAMMGIKVFLELFVRMEKDWSTNPKSLNKLGY